LRLAGDAKAQWPLFSSGYKAPRPEAHRRNEGASRRPTLAGRRAGWNDRGRDPRDAARRRAGTQAPFGHEGRREDEALFRARESVAVQGPDDQHIRVVAKTADGMWSYEFWSCRKPVSGTVDSEARESTTTSSSGHHQVVTSSRSFFARPATAHQHRHRPAPDHLVRDASQHPLPQPAGACVLITTRPQSLVLA